MKLQPSPRPRRARQGRYGILPFLSDGNALVSVAPERGQEGVSGSKCLACGGRLENQASLLKPASWNQRKGDRQSLGETLWESPKQGSGQALKPPGRRVKPSGPRGCAHLRMSIPKPVRVRAIPLYGVALREEPSGTPADSGVPREAGHSTQWILAVGRLVNQGQGWSGPDTEKGRAPRDFSSRARPAVMR